MINETNKFDCQNPSNQANSNNSSRIKHSKFISVSVNNRLGYFKQLITMLKMIQVEIHNVTSKIDKFVG